MNQMYPAFLADSGRVQVATMATTPDLLRANLRQTGLEVAVIDADLLIVEGERRLLDFLNREMGEVVALVLISPRQENMRGAIRDIHTVREVFTKPVNYGELITRVYQVGVSERAATAAIAPAQAYMASAPVGRGGTGVAGMKVFAFSASKGGTGKTTTAINFAYRLNQVGIRTLLMGFDVPDDIGSILGLPRNPNSLYFFRRSGRPGFSASVQQTRYGMDVVLSPNNHVEAARIAQRKPQEEGSIARLVEAARDHHPPYAAVVMDLPPTETEWSIQPMMRANTVVLVVQPSVPDEVKLIETIKLLTGVLDERYRVPKEAIYAVLNGVTDDDNITAGELQEAVAEFLKKDSHALGKDGYAPPVIATIPFQSRVRPLQNRGVLPVTSLDDYSRAIDNMVDFFYKDVLGKPSSVAAGRRKSLLPIRLKIT
jgi:cellulose biosynthesis protein BcsQ